jgi:hypothetical protein
MPKRRELQSLLILTAAALVLHAKELAGRRPYWRDTMRLYVPVKHYLAEVLRRGEWPVWWPFDSAGAPLLADPQFSVFHPSTLAYLILPFWPAFLLQDVIGTWLALVGAWLLARALRQPPLAALVGAILYGGCGYLVSLSEFQFMKLSAGMMPWYAWALIRAVERGGAWWVAPPAAMGLLLLGGDPQAAVLASIFGLAVVLARRGVPSAKAAAASALAPIGGALLAAVQLLPAQAIVSETARRGSMTELNDWPLAWMDVVSLALPFDNGTAGFVRSICLGVAGLALIFASLAGISRRRVQVLWALVLLGVWLALGDAFGLNWMARKVIPYWSVFRFPIKSVLLALLAAALLAGEGFRLLELPRAPAVRWARISGVAGAAILSVASVAFAQRPAAALVLLALFAAIATAVMMLPSSRMAAALFCIQVLVTGAFLLKTTSPDFYDAPPLVQALKDAGVGLTGASFDRFDEGIGSNVEGAYVERAAVGGRSQSFGALWNFPILGFSSPAASWRVVTIFGGGRIPFEIYARTFGLYGVGYVVITPDLLQWHPLPVVASEPEFHYSLAKLQRSLPRAYAVHRARPVVNVTAFKDQLLSGAVRPGREVFIEGNVPPIAQTRPDQLAVPASIVSRTNGTVAIEADLPWPGFIVLNEAAYKGWTVRVDGARAAALIANGCMRAVEAGQGRHRIEWLYEAPGLRLGLWISVWSWLVVIVIALALRRGSPART